MPRTLDPFDPLIIRQTNALTELMIVSQPMGVDLQGLKGYDYIRQAGHGITIYVIDSGANLQNPVRIFFVLDFRYYV